MTQIPVTAQGSSHWDGLQSLVARRAVRHLFLEKFRESVKKVEWNVGCESHRRLAKDLAKGRAAAAYSELRKQIDTHRERLVCDVS